MTTKILFLVLSLAICSSLLVCNAGGPKKKFHKSGGLEDEFYGESCPRAEEIVQRITERHVHNNPNLPAKLIRVLFHDCFVRVRSICLFFVKYVLIKVIKSMQIYITYILPFKKKIYPVRPQFFAPFLLFDCL